LDIKDIERDLNNINGVEGVHDLHVWSLAEGKTSLSCHLLSNNTDDTLFEAIDLLRTRYKIKHSTIQVENSNNKNIKCKHGLH